jgi:hypothetical protein
MQKMSIALDFSDMFKSQTDKKVSDAHIEKISSENLFTENENIPPTTSNSDDLFCWVKNNLLALNYNVKDEQINESSLHLWQKIITERLHWQNQTQSVAEENAMLRRKVEQSEKDKTSLRLQIDNMHQV